MKKGLVAELLEATSTIQPVARPLAQTLTPVSDLELYSGSIWAGRGILLALGRQAEDGHKQLLVLDADGSAAERFPGRARTVELDNTDYRVMTTPADATGATILRSLMPCLVARPWGLQKSAGCGDRLGLATPGHVRALRNTFGDTLERGMAPIFAQQSIRENERTGRTPQEVIDDAMWGVFQEGWQAGFGADADHLKTAQDVEICAAAGYTFFTVDPGTYVDDEANAASASVLNAKVEALPWEVLDSSPSDLMARLGTRPIDLGVTDLSMDEEMLWRAAAKYGKAVAHTASMYRHLQKVMGSRPFELEMSVDETETVTSLGEHVYIAAELQRLGLEVVSLAPRYVGTFEKGVDYIGDLAAFERSFAEHFAVAQTFGPYKLSLHSGSDKFSIYPIAARIAGDLVHLKTAGTSYLEALRAIAAVNPDLFRQIVAFAQARYPSDRATYHVSARLDRMPTVDRMADGDLAEVLEQFDAREILHVTFGSVLNEPSLRGPFFATLYGHEERYIETVERHFMRHFAPFR